MDIVSLQIKSDAEAVRAVADRVGPSVVTIVAIVLRWSARRWPLPGEKPDKNEEDD
jgi:hypothetical protein